jgi:LysR family transcriptional regulator, glycine cleavage system transcriptional activator
MKRSCPTISELLAFDALARQGSLTHAAEELCITVSAVSKHVASLEAFLDQALVRKVGRGLELTALGRTYWQKTAPNLRALEAASFEIKVASPRSGLLTLASVPTFLTKWLIPRLPAFRKHSPETTLSFSQHLGANEDIPSGVDAAIRYGSGRWPNLLADYIAGREFVLIYSPTLSKSGAKRKSGLDVTRETLLHHEQAGQAWEHWAKRQELGLSKVLVGPRFAQYSSLIQAAISGLGVGLVPKVLVLDELRDGVLHTSADPPIQLDQGHYLCYSPERLNLPVFAAFRTWILAEGQLDSRRF